MSSVVCRYRDEVDREPFHFNISGLPNVYLLSGYQLHETTEGPAVSFADTDGLNRALGRYLAHQRRRLTGQEWLFLRVEMDLSQAELARLLGVSNQQVASAELTGPAEILFRCIYLQHLGESVDLRTFSDRLQRGSFTQIDPVIASGNSRENWRLLRPA
jgi:DNA-binding transcriptional regulator YiaG